MILGDFNIHVDIENYSWCLGSTFISLLNSIGFSQFVCEHKSTHCFNHYLDLVPTHEIEIDHLTVSLHNPFLSDHELIPFERLTNKYTVKRKHFYSRFL